MPGTPLIRGPAGGGGAQPLLWALADELHHRHGITRVYARSHGRVGVVSVCLGVTVWTTDARWLRWQFLGETITWPATDPAGAAAQIAPLAPRPK
jgi:hypothetical protein